MLEDDGQVRVLNRHYKRNILRSSQDFTDSESNFVSSLMQVSYIFKQDQRF